jgi:hypothetical protein
MNLVKSKQRVANYGEVFTPAWMVEAMLDNYMTILTPFSPPPFTG